MSGIVKSAAKGNRKVMITLYEENKKHALFVADCLLCNKESAEEAVSVVFKSIWEELKWFDISEESEFSSLLTRKLVEYCRKRVEKVSPKAFRMPQKRNFIIPMLASTNIAESFEMKVLASLPSLQRFIFVMSHICGQDDARIAEFFGTDVKTIERANEAEPSNMERIVKLLSSQKSLEDVISDIKKLEETINVPEYIDTKIMNVIDKIAIPAEKKQKKMIGIVSASILAVILIVVCIFAIPTNKKNNDEDESGDDTETSDVDESVMTSPIIDLDEDATYYADIEIENYGTITVQLNQEAAPVTVANFINLAQNGFYDGLTFHRIIEGFMMQGGDPNGDGTGGSEQCIVGEFTDNGYDNSLSHTRGAISMARSSDYNSASSQFFIVHEDCSDSLDGQYAVFGYVTEGLEIVDQVCEDAEPTDSNGTIEADAQPVITSITIRTE